jgi:hypothetical protein
MKLSRSVRWLLLALLLSAIPASSFAGVFISVGFAPPVMPVYEQPLCPQSGLMWTPGYWAYGDDGYYWVPGAWVPAPYEGALWTPGYWGWSGGLYVFHDGYWGPHVGYYGGVNYGFGYGGIGFAGGMWRGHEFAYNTAVVHVNETVIHTTYVDRTIVERTTIVNDRHVAFSGGPGGINHPPSPEERIAEHDQHVQPTSFQQHHIETARTDKASYVKNNGGHPAHLVAEKPLAAESHPAPPTREVTGAGEGRVGTGNSQHSGPPAHSPAPVPMHSTEGTHPAPPASHPVEAMHPAPQSHPMPQEHPAPQAHPAPQQHPAPQAHPAPRPKPEGHEK